MIGPALVLVLATLTLLLGGVAYVLLVWKPPHARETRLFLESRDADAMLQLAPTVRGPSPEWMRLNLRDGRAVLAVAVGDDGATYEVAVVPVDREPASGPEPEELRYRLHREAREKGLGEAVALSDAGGARVGTLAPTEARRLGLPAAWEGHLSGRPLRLTGREAAADDVVQARLFPNTVPRLTPVQWATELDEEARLQAAVLVFVLRWNELLVRAAALRRDEG